MGNKMPSKNLWMAQSPELKKMFEISAGMVPVLLHPFLYRALKLTFPKNVGGVVSGG